MSPKDTYLDRLEVLNSLKEEWNDSLTFAKEYLDFNLVEVGSSEEVTAESWRSLKEAHTDYKVLKEFHTKYLKMLIDGEVDKAIKFADSILFKWLSSIDNFNQ